MTCNHNCEECSYLMENTDDLERFGIDRTVTAVCGLSMTGIPKEVRDEED